MKVHELKLDDVYFNDVRDGKKTFEIRKNDRDFEEGDLLALSRYKDGSYCYWNFFSKFHNSDIHNADTLLMLVTYVTDYEQKDGYVVMGISPLIPNEAEDD
ncbi:DUF3850 domain-containing protein [Weissella paramesenteroides]|uniref:DUF3850 domain-containing protein n=1 Tax=Weissella paramesenteroides TaxID=1249 RepID=UPI0023A9D59C|nr:DUF3850 domain-containing protein [Weissella paramesenteroides]WEA53357.1 DUF3850 domain-containing protein [Weissella paramesenteroides]